MALGTRSTGRARQFFLSFAFLAFLGIPISLLAQPATYFAGAAGLTGMALKEELRDIIDGHTSIPYTSSSTDVWDAHKDLYEDPNDSSRLILFYSQASWDKNAQDPGSGSEQYWNREHLWPRSYGVDDSSVSDTDLFNLVPANKRVNNVRGNKYFDITNPADGSYKNPADPLAPECTSDSNSWEPGDGQKGWVARALFYMTTRYINLQLIDTPPSSPPASSLSNMAQLSVMLDWNRRFLPSGKEREVNQGIFEDYQGNRNPYIDFPEFADAVFISGPSWGAWRLEHFSLAELLDLTISGDDADPDKDGLSNLIEMARYSDPRDPSDGIPVNGFISGPSTVEITFHRATSDDDLNLTMLLQVSTNLSNWTTVPLTGADIDPAGPNQESVTVTRTLAPGTAEFYRLKVIRP
jgi:endonuclease I